MRILDRYIVREIVRHAFLGLLIFTFVLFVPKLVRLMELFVRHSGSGSQILALFLCIVPGILVFTIPMAVLIGVLLGLGRMSMDSEIIALTSLGISRKRILLPVGVLAVVGAVLTLLMTIVLAPRSLRAFRDIEAGLIASQISFQVQPRVFDERFPHLVLYINDVSASGTHWHGVFLFETSAESGSRITLAEGAIVIAEAAQGKLELHLNSGTTHEFQRETPDQYSVTAFERSDWPIEFTTLENEKVRVLSNPERSLADLWHDRGLRWRDARVELYQRFAFPFACFAFALIAVPLGAQPRRGGRAAGTLLSVLIIAGYYLLFIMGAGLARQGVVPPFVGMWAANVILLLAGLALLPRMERYWSEPSPLSFIARFMAWRRLVRQRRTRSKARHAVRKGNGDAVAQETYAVTSSNFPSIIDIYLLRRFSYYFVLVLGAFILLF